MCLHPGLPGGRRAAVPLEAGRLDGCAAGSCRPAGLAAACCWVAPRPLQPPACTAALARRCPRRPAGAGQCWTPPRWRLPLLQQACPVGCAARRWAQRAAVAASCGARQWATTAGAATPHNPCSPMPAWRACPWTDAGARVAAVTAWGASWPASQSRPQAADAMPRRCAGHLYRSRQARPSPLQSPHCRWWSPRRRRCAFQPAPASRVSACLATTCPLCCRWRAGTGSTRRPRAAARCPLALEAPCPVRGRLALPCRLPGRRGPCVAQACSRTSGVCSARSFGLCCRRGQLRRRLVWRGSCRVPAAGPAAALAAGGCLGGNGSRGWQRRAAPQRAGARPHGRRRARRWRVCGSQLRRVGAAAAAPRPAAVDVHRKRQRAQRAGGCAVPLRAAAHAPSHHTLHARRRCLHVRSLPHCCCCPRCRPLWATDAPQDASATCLAGWGPPQSPTPPAPRPSWR